MEDEQSVLGQGAWTQEGATVFWGRLEKSQPAAWRWGPLSRAWEDKWEVTAWT